MEARQVTGQTSAEDVAAWILDRGTGAVVVHAGGDGAYVAAPAYSGWIPANAVTVVDTTGAGEAFDAGLVFGLASGWGMEEAARLACAVGALATTATGCVDGITGLAPALALARGQR